MIGRRASGSSDPVGPLTREGSGVVDARRTTMGSEKITYAGVIGAAAGFVGIMGLASGWFTDGTQVVEAPADVSGKLAFAMSIGTFVFWGAYILMSDPGIRRAMGALVTLCAVVLIL